MEGSCWLCWPIHLEISTQTTKERAKTLTEVSTKDRSLSKQQVRFGEPSRPPDLAISRDPGDDRQVRIGESTVKKIAALCLLVGWFVAMGYSQDTGMPSYQVLLPVNAFESVNLGNLDVLVNAPVRSKDGVFPLNFSLATNSLIFVDANKVYRSTASHGLAYTEGATLGKN